MRWTPGGRSSDLEDRRSEGSGGMQVGGMHLGIGGVVILLILSVVFHRNFLALLGDGGPASLSSPAGQVDPQQDAREEPEVQFVSFVLDDAQSTWTKVLSNEGGTYRHAKLVLFRDAIRSGCGSAQSASGPFYCPADEKVYIDLGFYDELRDRYGASGQFAQAYVLAHEIGHHVQKLIGIERKVRQAQEENPGARNQLSVRLELQADCFAGIWAHSTEQRKLLEAGDVEQAMNAASAVGDDRLQSASSGQIRPESFTHGTSAQRSQWFQRGFSGGALDSCNTFQ
ncbi:MAG TPA: neutral zinc metallopeptidase [Terriglobales bacterium]